MNNIHQRLREKVANRTPSGAYNLKLKKIIYDLADKINNNFKTESLIHKEMPAQSQAAFYQDFTSSAKTNGRIIANAYLLLRRGFQIDINKNIFENMVDSLPTTASHMDIIEHICLGLSTIALKNYDNNFEKISEIIASMDPFVLIYKNIIQNYLIMENSPTKQKIAFEIGDSLVQLNEYVFNKTTTQEQFLQSLNDLSLKIIYLSLESSGTQQEIRSEACALSQSFSQTFNEIPSSTEISQSSQDLSPRINFAQKTPYVLPPVPKIEIKLTPLDDDQILLNYQTSIQRDLKMLNYKSAIKRELQSLFGSNDFEENKHDRGEYIIKFARHKVETKPDSYKKLTILVKQYDEIERLQPKRYSSR